MSVCAREGQANVRKAARVHFLTAYFEYLLDQGIRTEEAYVGDASRFLRYLVGQATPTDVQQFMSRHSHSVHYSRRLKRTLTKFFAFAQDQLGIDNDPLS